ncbi:hypothetical protein GW17_00056103 [Ensete ventricosum]|nr:hypothetical protein GW17_00056103 [Ensete ventricosum]
MGSAEGDEFSVLTPPDVRTLADAPRHLVGSKVAEKVCEFVALGGALLRMCQTRSTRTQLLESGHEKSPGGALRGMWLHRRESQG